MDRSDPWRTDMRLGEMLLATGAIGESELEVARTHQLGTGARLGTTLIGLGFLEADDLARALARQHGVPAALIRHLQERDPELAERIPAAIARDLCALPVALSRGAAGVNLVVCFRDPDPDIIAAVSEAAGMPVIPAVAGELVLDRELRRAYPEAFAGRSAATMAAAVPEADDSFDVDFEDDGFGALEQLSLVDLDDKRVSRDHSQTLMLPGHRDTAQGARVRPPLNDSPAPSRTTASRDAEVPALPRTVTDRGVSSSAAPPPDPAARAATVPPPSPGPGSARMAAVPPEAATPSSPSASGRFPTVTFDQVARVTAPQPVTRPPSASGRMAAASPESAPRTTVEGATLCTGPRDPVAERVLPHLISSWRIALVLAVEPERATARTGIGATLTAAMLERVDVSLTVPSLLQSVIAARRAHVGDALDASGAPRESWLQGLTEHGARELAIAPVIVGDRVIRLVVAIGARLEIGAAAGEVLRVARTMIDAYRAGPS